MGYVALTTHLRPSNFSVGNKRLEYIPSNTVQTIRSSLTLDIDDSKQTQFLFNSSFFLDIQNHNNIVYVYKRPAVGSTSTSRQLHKLQLLKSADSAFNHSTLTTNTVSPVH